MYGIICTSQHVYYAVITGLLCLMKKAKAKTQKKHIEPELRCLGERIRQLRKGKGYKSAETFAYEHDFPRITYTAFERGSNLTFISLVKLARAFEMRLEELLGEGFEEIYTKSEKRKR